MFVHSLAPRCDLYENLAFAGNHCLIFAEGKKNSLLVRSELAEPVNFQRFLKFCPGLCPNRGDDGQALMCLEYLQWNNCAKAICLPYAAWLR